MTVLAMDEKTLEALHSLRKFAEDPKNHITYEQLLKLSKGEGGAIGDNADYVCYPSLNYRCVFSIEHHPGGRCRHLSVSIEKKGRLPMHQAVEMIMAELGFEGGINDQINVTLEEEFEAVSVMGGFKE